MNLERLADLYREELLEGVIPFWLRHSLDGEFGGHFTCLTRQGDVYDSRKYVWMQGRAVWMLSKLYCEFDPRAEWIDAARLVIPLCAAKRRCFFGRSASLFMSLRTLSAMRGTTR